MYHVVLTLKYWEIQVKENLISSLEESPVIEKEKKQPAKITLSKTGFPAWVTKIMHGAVYSGFPRLSKSCWFLHFILAPSMQTLLSKHSSQETLKRNVAYKQKAWIFSLALIFYVCKSNGEFFHYCWGCRDSLKTHVQAPSRTRWPRVA